MRGWEGYTVLLFLLTTTGVALLAPWQWVLILFLALFLQVRLWVFTVTTLVLSTVLLGALLEPGAWHWDGAAQGTIGGMRVVATTLAGVIVVQHGPAIWLESLRLPRTLTAWLAAILIAARQLGDDARAWQWQMRASGDWPKSKWSRVKLTAAVVIPLTDLAIRRASRRREALQLIGIGTPQHFVPIVAFTALAILGRVLLLALPNVSLTYMVVFLAGYSHGAQVGGWVGMLSMTMTNLMVSGFHPVMFATAPAMATLGLLGGWLRRWPLDRFTAGAIGFFATLWFGALSDVLSWFIIPEFRESLALLWLRVGAGLTFNLIPGLFNAALFAAVFSRNPSKE